MPATPTDLRIDDLTVEFSKGDYTVRPLDHLTVTVEAGTLALLLGPSGCGKTTLLSCLAAILKPTSGSITFGGAEITALTGRELTEHRRHGVGVVFQAFNLVPSLNSIENVAVPMRSAGVRLDGPPSDEAVELLHGRRTRRPADPQAEQPERRSTTAGGHRPRPGARPAAGAGRRAHRPPRLRPGRERAAPHPQPHRRRSRRARVDPRRPDAAARRSDHRDAPRLDARRRRPRPTPVTLAAGEHALPPGRSERPHLRRRDAARSMSSARHPDGELLLATLGPGDHLGEMGPLFGLPRSATVRARSDTLLTGYTAKAFRDLVGAEQLPALIRGRSPERHRTRVREARRIAPSPGIPHRPLEGSVDGVELLTGQIEDLGAGHAASLLEQRIPLVAERSRGLRRRQPRGRRSIARFGRIVHRAIRRSAPPFAVARRRSGA